MGMDVDVVLGYDNISYYRKTNIRLKQPGIC